MEIIADKSFEKDFKRLPSSIKSGMVHVYDVLSAAQNQWMVSSMPQVKSMVSNKGFYRLKVGDYRIGFYFKEDVLLLSRVLHKKEIYRFFPPR